MYKSNIFKNIISTSAAMIKVLENWKQEFSRLLPSHVWMEMIIALENISQMIHTEIELYRKL